MEKRKSQIVLSAALAIVASFGAAYLRVRAGTRVHAAMLAFVITATIVLFACGIAYFRKK